MFQIDPGEPFVIVRVLERHTDTNTYYVRAVIRRQDGSSISTIETVDLTDQSSRIFSKTVQAPVDASPQGLYIFVTTSVYTDSGYTTKSPNYGDQTVTYLVAQRWHLRFSGGGGVSEQRLREVVADEVQKLLADLPKPKEIDLKGETGSLRSHLSRIEDAVRSIRIPKMDIPKLEKTDLVPVLRELRTLREAVGTIEIPVTDLTPAVESVERGIRELSGRLHEITDTVNRANQQNKEELTKKIESLVEDIRGSQFMIPLQIGKSEERARRRLLI